MLELQLSKQFNVCPKALQFTGRDRQVDGLITGVIFAAERYTGYLFPHPHKNKKNKTCSLVYAKSAIRKQRVILGSGFAQRKQALKKPGCSSR